MTRKHHTPTDQEVLDRMPPIPVEADTVGLLKVHQERQDGRQLVAIESKDVRVEVYLKP